MIGIFRLAIIALMFIHLGAVIIRWSVLVAVAWSVWVALYCKFKTCFFRQFGIAYNKAVMRQVWGPSPLKNKELDTVPRAGKD